MYQQYQPFGRLLLLIFTKSIVSTQLSFIFPSSDIYRSGITWQFSLLASFCYSYSTYSQTASFPFNCPSFLLDRISTNLAYPSSITLYVSFCYSYSQTASFLLKCRSPLLLQISTNLASIAVLAFRSVSVTHIHKESRFHSTVVQLYHFKSISIRDIRAVLVVWLAFITFIYKKHCLGSNVVHLHQFRYPRVRHFQAVLAFWSASVSFFHGQHHLYSTIVHLYQFRYLRSQDTLAVRAFLSVFVAFIQ